MRETGRSAPAGISLPEIRIPLRAQQTQESSEPVFEERRKKKKEVNLAIDNYSSPKAPDFVADDSDFTLPLQASVAVPAIELDGAVKASFGCRMTKLNWI
jgi:hypothetical protein